MDRGLRPVARCKLSVHPPYLNQAAQAPSEETMQGPTAEDGVQAFPKSLHSGGSDLPINIFPHKQPAGSGASEYGILKRFTASKAA